VSPGSTTRVAGDSLAGRWGEAGASAVLLVLSVFFCWTAWVEAQPVSWASAMGGSIVPRNDANESASPAISFPKGPLRLVLKTFPPYSERITLP
jgi:hypothetical protein